MFPILLFSILPYRDEYSKIKGGPIVNCYSMSFLNDIQIKRQYSYFEAFQIDSSKLRHGLEKCYV